MHYQKNRQLLRIAAALLLSATIVTGQKKVDGGYLFGNAVFAADRQGDYATPAAGIAVEIKGPNRIITITTNEAGLVDKKLPVGTYYLVGAKTAEGVLLDFKSDQFKCFQIKPDKTARFDIVVLKPKS